jgi:uncharacterized protein Yka (UPF0111/DUF47 family)
VAQIIIKLTALTVTPLKQEELKNLFARIDRIFDELEKLTGFLGKNRPKFEKKLKELEKRKLVQNLPYFIRQLL